MERAARKFIKTRTGSLFWQVDPTRTGIRVATAAVIGTIKRGEQTIFISQTART